MIVVNTSFRLAPWADVLYGMDRPWWRAHIEEVSRTFKGRKLTLWQPMPGGVERADVPNLPHNSGAAGIALAAHYGAKRIVLIGYDLQHTGGRRHWHEDHPQGLGNAGSIAKWPAIFADTARRLPKDVEVINASAETALTLWPRMPLEEALALDDLEPLVVEGMHGMGDNLHQRAIVREYMRSHRVYLRTPWPELYHDLQGPRLALLRPETRLRTQAKNVVRSQVFDDVAPPARAACVRVSYPPAMVRKHRGVLAAMAEQCDVPQARDFSLPVPEDWRHGLSLPTDRPVIVYRPLVERREWAGAAARNPNREAYVEVLQAIRHELGAYVVSVADLAPGQEWIVSEDIRADLELHGGELDIRQLCALWRDAGLVYTAPGFGLVLAQAIGTPVVSLFGGYERAYSFRDDPLTCKIEPRDACDCFTHHHRCGQKMDTRAAIAAALDFVRGLAR